MTDDQMHARLREAGERWRGANTATADPDGEELVFAPAKQSHHRRWLAMASAAVIAAALVIGGRRLCDQQSSDRPATGASRTSAIGRLEGVDWIDKVSGAFGQRSQHTRCGFQMVVRAALRAESRGNRWTIGRQIGPLSVCPSAAATTDRVLSPAIRATRQRGQHLLQGDDRRSPDGAYRVSRSCVRTVIGPTLSS